MQTINLENRSLFKLSMGLIFKAGNNLIQQVENDHWIVMGANTGKGQGRLFQEGLQIGDLVYICYGSERLSYIGEVTSEAISFPSNLHPFIGVNGDWVYREVRPLHQPVDINLKDLTRFRDGFMPSGNTTFYRVSGDRLERANNILFGPKYDVQFSNGNNQRQDETRFNQISLADEPLNQILYGPPGTGKTYILQNEYFPLFKDSGISRTKKEFEAEIISQLSWWRVIAMILLKEGEMSVPDMKEHHFTKYKLAVSNTNSLNQTFWGQLSSHTVEESTTVEYSSRSKTLVFNKKEQGSIWFIEESKKETLLDLSMMLSEISDYQEESNDKDNYSFVTFHQSYGYEDFVIGIKPVLENKSDDSSEDVSYSLAKGVFYKACDEASKLAGYLSLKDAIENSDKEERKQNFSAAKRYGLFIDEINRGNVSAIFGELITLIEEDKRIGAENEMILDIPNSKSKFGIPLNLHIFGTMNTADRSVEALDTALRRRFTFNEMLPLSDKIITDGKSNNGVINSGTIDEIDLSNLLEVINDRIEVLVDRDHTIGHAYFMEVDSTEKLQRAFENKIIPLLQEYFYGDYRKMEMVIGSYFFDQDKLNRSDDIFAKTTNAISVEIGVYQFKQFDSENFDIIDAVRVLLNRPKKSEMNPEVDAEANN